MTLHYAAVTHRGKVRDGNEDNFWIDGFYRSDITVHETSQNGQASPSRFLAAVCDGMGGEAAGEVASLLAVESLSPHGFLEFPEGVLQDVRSANSRLCQYMIQHGGLRCGSTLAALYIDQGQAMCCNVGDSRIYLFRDGQMRQLSKDHSRAQQMVDMGIFSPEKARNSPARHELTQHLGIFEEEMLIEPWTIPPMALNPEDRFLLCSDGLTDMVQDTEIARILASSESPEKQADMFLEKALHSGGQDNITILVLHTSLL